MLFVQRHHRRATGMMDHFHFHPVAIRQRYLLHIDMNDSALERLLRLFVQRDSLTVQVYTGMLFNMVMNNNR
jgi:hypothetical protein